MARIGLLLVGVSTKNFGGAERFFTDLFLRYSNSEKKTHHLLFFSDKETLNNLDETTGIKNQKKVIRLANINNRLKGTIEGFEFILKLLYYRITIVQITSYTVAFESRIKALRFIPSILRPKLILTIVDCEVPFALSDPKHPKHSDYKRKYLPLFNQFKLSGIMTWYNSFVNYSSKIDFGDKLPFIKAITTRYSDFEQTGGYGPKKKIIVWAARMTAQKRPEIMVKAISILKLQNFDFQGWSFNLYGDGPAYKKIFELINELNLNELVSCSGHTNLKAVFAETSCFVSTQQYENFPSLSMMEAMASGNAVIAFDVGDTNVMLKHMLNGIMIDIETAESLAEGISYYINNPHLHDAFAKYSVHLTNEVHTFNEFKIKVDDFWGTIEKK